MKILIYSPAFLPSVGGLEIGTAILAEEWTALGCEAVVATTTSAGERAEASAVYRVVRNPSAIELLRLTRWCDVFYQSNISLRGLWPLLFVRRPWAVSHHSWYCRTEGHVAWPDRLKRRLLRHAAVSIAVSQAMANDLEPRPLVIGNAYRDETFRPLPGIARDRELAVVGRLVSDKGIDLLLDALPILEREFGLRPRLTVIGDGPERPRLEGQASRLGLGERIEWTGTLGAEAIARTLHRHQILVVPSRYREPFGNVALEGIACGCAVVASAGGGLPDAIGPCGRTFPNGDVGALAATLAALLAAPEQRRALLARAPEHLAEHTRRRVARRYLDAIEAGVGPLRRRA